MKMVNLYYQVNYGLVNMKKCRSMSVTDTHTRIHTQLQVHVTNIWTVRPGNVSDIFHGSFLCQGKKKWAYSLPNLCWTSHICCFNWV